MSGGPQHGDRRPQQPHRNENEVTQRVRAVATIDTRQQTAYGTLRTYMLLGYNTGHHGAGYHFTAGVHEPRLHPDRRVHVRKATSFFDIFPNAAFAYNAGNNFSGDRATAA